MNTRTTWACAAALAFVMAASINLDGPEDLHAEWDKSEALKDLQASEAGSARRQAAAQKLCNQERGPNSEARWLEDGSLVCTMRSGVRRASL